MTGWDWKRAIILWALKCDGDEHPACPEKTEMCLYCDRARTCCTAVAESRTHDFFIFCVLIVFFAVCASAFSASLYKTSLQDGDRDARVTRAFT